MPCVCTANLCASCACGSRGALCSNACHGGGGLTANSCCLNTVEGQKAAALPLGEVRKTLARAGLDVIGNANELKRRLADHMLSSAASSVTADTTTAAAPGPDSGRARSSAAIIRDVNAAPDDYAAILSLAGSPITAASPPDDVRKAYRLLALRLHPDKNGNSAEAKQAFQALVLAFERISEVPLPDGGRGDAVATKHASQPRTRVDTSVVHSNVGCVQTRVLCPRCGMDWPRAELGLEPGAYTFFMMGLKEYTCGRCACLFGCMAATHQCPHCRKPFDYAPFDFHRHVRCGNGGCTSSFGFLQAAVSARRLAEVKRELLASQEERMRRADARARREGRAKTRAPETASAATTADSGGVQQAEAAFRLELVDECPRCGAHLTVDDASGLLESPDEHLKRCTDSKAHATHAAAIRARAAAAKATAARASAAEVSGALAAWEACGRVVGTLWTLPEAALASLCAGAGLAATAPSKDILVRRYADHCRAVAAMSRSGRLLEDGSADGVGSRRKATGAAAVDVAGIADVDSHELPSNLHSLDAAQLACVAAAFGIAGSASDGKAVLIRRLEGARFAGREADAGIRPRQSAGAVIGDVSAAQRRRAIKNYAEVSSSSSSSDEDGSSDDEDVGFASDASSEGDRRRKQKKARR